MQLIYNLSIKSLISDQRTKARVLPSSVCLEYMVENSCRGNSQCSTKVPYTLMNLLYFLAVQ